MFILGEGYWNFGLIGALLVAIASAALAVRLESWFRKQEPIVVCTYFATIGTVGFGAYYGLQTFVKSIEIALVLGLAMKLVLAFMRRRYEYRIRLLQSHIDHARSPRQSVARLRPS